MPKETVEERRARKRAYMAKWREENYGRSKAYAKALYAANREKQVAAQREWYRQNSERAKAHQRANHAATREERNAKRAEYRIANLEKEKAREAAYRTKHYQDILARNRTRRAAKRGAPGRHTKNDIDHFFEMQKGRCAYCATALMRSGWHVDHVTPLSRGGGNDRSNPQLLCPTCNCRKGDRDPIEWVQRLGFLI